MLCNTCGGVTKILIDGLCRGCWDDQPKSVEFWIKTINHQLDSIVEKIDDINKQLREVVKNG